MSALADLKTLLSTKAADISFDLDKAECLADIDTWYAARTALDALGADEISSYTMRGRTFNRRNMGEFRTEERQLYDRIMGRLYPGGALADLRDLGGLSR